MISRILVPLDGSTLAEGVLPTLEDLASPLHAEVHLLQAVHQKPELVVREPGPAPRVDPAIVGRTLEEDTRTARAYLSRVAGGLAEKGMVTKCEVVNGEPAATILHYARAHEIQLIAMSTHGRSGLSRMVSGSVADQVVRDAGIPVLLVKPGHENG